jgi:hypothetical protein
MQNQITHYSTQTSKCCVITVPTAWNCWRNEWIEQFKIQRRVFNRKMKQTWMESRRQNSSARMHISFSFITFSSVSQYDDASPEKGFPERWTVETFLQQKVTISVGVGRKHTIGMQGRQQDRIRTHSRDSCISWVLRQWNECERWKHWQSKQMAPLTQKFKTKKNSEKLTMRAKT